MKKACLVFLTTLYILTGCSHSSTEEAVSNSIPKETDSSALATETKSQDSHSFVLSFKDSEIEKKPLTKTASIEKQVILTRKKFENNEVEIYRKENDKENVYAALLSDSNRYEIGLIGYSSTQETNDFTITEVDALSKSLIKITGFCGANCPITDYVETDNSVPALLRVDAHTIEADVNNDGIKEIVATVGTAAQTSIYKLQGDKIVVANLNEIFNAPVVIYDSKTNTFQAEVTKGQLSNWKITNDQLQLIP